MTNIVILDSVTANPGDLSWDFLKKYGELTVYDCSPVDKIYERANEITAGKTKYSGEYPESEPETQALANFIRLISEELKGIITLHTQGEEIYCKPNGITVKNTEIISRHVSRMCGYPICDTEGSASYGGLTDYAIRELNIPSYTLECGKGENPLDIKQSKSVYTRLRELLFTFPILF